jgi:hypothetical protein
MAQFARFRRVADRGYCRKRVANVRLLDRRSKEYARRSKEYAQNGEWNDSV